MAQRLEPAPFHPDGLAHLGGPLVQLIRRLRMEPELDQRIALRVAVRRQFPSSEVTPTPFISAPEKLATMPG